MVGTCNRRTTQSGGLHRRSQCRGVGHFGIDVALVFYTGGHGDGHDT